MVLDGTNICMQSLRCQLSPQPLPPDAPVIPCTPFWRIHFLESTTTMTAGEVKYKKLLQIFAAKPCRYAPKLGKLVGARTGDFLSASDYGDLTITLNVLPMESSLRLLHFFTKTPKILQQGVTLFYSCRESLQPLLFALLSDYPPTAILKLADVGTVDACIHLSDAIKIMDHALSIRHTSPLVATFLRIVTNSWNKPIDVPEQDILKHLVKVVKNLFSNNGNDRVRPQTQGEAVSDCVPPETELSQFRYTSLISWPYCT